MARRIAGKTKKPKRTRKPKRKVSRRVKKTARAKKISEVLSSTYSAPKSKSKSKPKRTRKPKSEPKGKMTYRSFVKKNFQEVKDEMPSGTPAPQIIKRIASLWKKQKTKEQSAWKP